jgi:hypothetical protein
MMTCGPHDTSAKLVAIICGNSASHGQFAGTTDGSLRTAT